MEIKFVHPVLLGARGRGRREGAGWQQSLTQHEARKEKKGETGGKHMLLLQSSRIADRSLCHDDVNEDAEARDRGKCNSDKNLFSVRHADMRAGQETGTGHRTARRSPE